jgi:anti-sigma factor RsiW
MISCYRFERCLTAYADGELSPRTRRAVERHLATCPRCAAELDSILASDTILRRAVPPAVSPERWSQFRRNLDMALDAIDREARKRARLPEARPVDPARRRGWAVAVACAAFVLAVVAFGPKGMAPLGPWRGGNACSVESIETYVEGLTPMFFTSEDPEMTVIWVFSDESEGPSGRQ